MDSHDIFANKTVRQTETDYTQWNKTYSKLITITQWHCSQSPAKHFWQHQRHSTKGDVQTAVIGLSRSQAAERDVTARTLHCRGRSQRRIVLAVIRPIQRCLLYTTLNRRPFCSQATRCKNWRLDDLSCSTAVRQATYEQTGSYRTLAVIAHLYDARASSSATMNSFVECTIMTELGGDKNRRKNRRRRCHARYRRKSPWSRFPAACDCKNCIFSVQVAYISSATTE